MALRLGEMLVKAGRITSAQLDEALKSQVIFGGRLGTNLIEMGCIEEEELARVLSEKLRVPRVDPEELMNIPPSVVELVPLEMVEQFRIIPLRLENRRLFLVMADPSDLPAIDQIAFRTGFVIVPLVAPEIRLQMALEKYYDIRRELRYLPVSKELGGRKACGYRPNPVDVARAASRDVVDFSTLSVEGEEHYPWEDAAGVDVRVEAAQQYTIDSLSRALADAPDREAVARALVGYVGQEFDRVALLLVARDTVAGWMAVGGGRAGPAVRRAADSLRRTVGRAGGGPGKDGLPGSRGPYAGKHETAGCPGGWRARRGAPRPHGHEQPGGDDTLRRGQAGPPGCSA